MSYANETDASNNHFHFRRNLLILLVLHFGIVISHITLVLFYVDLHLTFTYSYIVFSFSILTYECQCLCIQGSGLIQMKVPQVSEGSGEKGSQTALPVVLFVTLEYHDAVCLVQKVHKSLATLSKVIRGTVLPSNDIIYLADTIINQQVCHNYYHPRYCD
jgi:hypothetical protein